MKDLSESHYVTIEFTIPETHADQMREAIGKAGAGNYGNYSFCTFSTKGIGRFLPKQNAHPFLGKPDILETVIEEKITTCCHKKILSEVLEIIKQTHPYEETMIDIYPTYKIGYKKFID